MPLVDPFIPTRPRQQMQIPSPSPVARPKSAAPGRKPDIYAVRAAPKTQPLPGAFVPRAFTAPPPQISRLKSNLQLTAIIIWALALGLGTYVQGVGEAAILSYAVVALALRFSSRATFALALCAFTIIVVLQIIQPDSSILTNFAVYAFLLLVIGSIAAGLEVRQQKSWSLRRHKSRTKAQRL